MTVLYTHQHAFLFKAQERVLGRENHVINISGREELHVSLRCDNVTESSKQSKASANQVSGTVIKQTDSFDLCARSTLFSPDTM